jgi:hypothetical protein
MKIERIKVYGMDSAIYGMRNPMNSWDKSDSGLDSYDEFMIGNEDNKLAKKLIKAGSDHRKYLFLHLLKCLVIFGLN